MGYCDYGCDFIADTGKILIFCHVFDTHFMPILI